MKRTYFFALIVTCLVGTSTAFAHDEKFHKGKPTDGEVVSLAGNTLIMKTDAGTMKVDLSDETAIERGEDKASKADLKPGEHVAVFGTKLSAEELVAKEIHIHGDGEEHGGHHRE